MNLIESVAFDLPTTTTDAYGAAVNGWTEQFTARAKMKYERGREAGQAGRVTGTNVFKVCLRSSTQSRGLTTEYRMRDIRRGIAYNIREVDAVTSRHWVWISVEGGVAI